MNYLKYILAAGVSYLLQTTLCADWPFKPELVLLLFCLFFSGHSVRAVWAGLGTGLALDLCNGYGFYNTILYTLAGAVCGFLPPGVFQDRRSLALVGFILSTLLLQFGHPFLTLIFLRQAICAPLPVYLGTLAADMICFFCLYWLFWREQVSNG